MFCGNANCPLDDDDDDDEGNGNDCAVFDLAQDENADDDCCPCSQSNVPQCNDFSSGSDMLLEEQQHCGLDDAVDVCSEMPDNHDDCLSQILNSRGQSTAGSASISDSELNCFCGDQRSSNDQQDELEYATVNLCNLMQIKRDLNDTLKGCVSRVRSINCQIEKLQDKLVQLLAEETRQETNCEDRATPPPCPTRIRKRGAVRRTPQYAANCDMGEREQTSALSCAGIGDICPKYTPRNPIMERNGDAVNCSQFDDVPTSFNNDNKMMTLKRKREPSCCARKMQATRCEMDNNVDIDRCCNRLDSNHCPS